MFGFSSFGPGGPRREGGDREEEHLRDGRGEVIRQPLAKRAIRAIQGASPPEGVPGSMPEVAEDLKGLSLEGLKEREVLLSNDYDKAERDLTEVTREINSGLLGIGLEERRQQLLDRKANIHYKLLAVQEAIEAKKVWQETPKTKND